ncbi:MAG TPA: ribonuclease HII [Fimbriimonadaceae bacterium]|nr:ribonuclease HII [Fimbriimonadaceae bacterium]HRJ95698.1 ribonuclease HII [Fimbriimonadaceae bacterium]
MSLRKLYGTAGIDEAGRGPLAGPVVAAAVVLPRGFPVHGIDDSKRLAPSEREELAERIRDGATWSVAVVDVEEIDRLNILWASMRAMEIAFSGLVIEAGRVVIDGDRIPPGLAHLDGCRAIVDGDAKIACIAAASILAKTARDALMRGLAEEHPGYGFERHFGYATPEHLRALRELGPCPIHRRTFSPVKEMVLQPCLIFDA